MKRLSMLLAITAAAGSGMAHSEIFKCTSAQGHVSYAAIPCDGAAEVAVQRPGPPKMLRQGEPVDHAHKVNLKATEYLQVSGRAKVNVYETESYKAFQKSHLPAPDVPSQCQSPRYDSQCFDPSGGASFRKAVTGN
ncbi:MULTISPECIES: DUF4124 domain-containing protein [Pseudomonas syringae group]|uniref:DUF4124 domain-containing protein n=2 Tax=Pseudomonas viridiflava TaxID=33069 RepID=A0AA46W4L4_PSEVI|nr:DUF4124 domain-containing protein [Pseudomonas viridiflava]MBD8807752.1 DUF4124 domain-containing protein [Pseudomonas syringae]KIQ27402.1 iron ABC transporter substrate-binding protein [Pseudomonas viridiflava]MBI6702181.1 DUF4124 domain-containing protein [Pseudomonas viridiflava]MBI6724451.1 DUF4124 domain-containing protein [Pseudomonas viridiflava]MBV1810919.1 DUF4124 domain-containing protein [Pseudomonas viridiflava]